MKLPVVKCYLYFCSVHLFSHRTWYCRDETVNVVCRLHLKKEKIPKANLVTKLPVLFADYIFCFFPKAKLGYKTATAVCRVHFPLKKSRFEPLPEMMQPMAGTSGLEPISPPLAHSQRTTPLPRSPSPDPYEFSDEASVNPATMTTRTRPSRDRQSPRLVRSPVFVALNLICDLSSSEQGYA